MSDARQTDDNQSMPDNISLGDEGEELIPESDIPGATLVGDKKAEQTIDEMSLETVERDDGDDLTLPAVESLIRRKVGQIGELKEKSTQLREMVDDVLINDADYTQAMEAAKEAVKAKTAAKVKMMNQPEVRQAVEKLRDVKDQTKDLTESLSANLREYERLAGTNQIELGEGDLRQIIFNAKLVKRAQQ